MKSYSYAALAIWWGTVALEVALLVRVWRLPEAVFRGLRAYLVLESIMSVALFSALAMLGNRTFYDLYLVSLFGDLLASFFLLKGIGNSLGSFPKAGVRSYVAYAAGSTVVAAWSARYAASFTGSHEAALVFGISHFTGYWSALALIALLASAWSGSHQLSPAAVRVGIGFAAYLVGSFGIQQLAVLSHWSLIDSYAPPFFFLVCATLWFSATRLRAFDTSPEEMRELAADLRRALSTPNEPDSAEEIAE